MEQNIYKIFASSNEWLKILPEILLCTAGLALVAFDMLFKNSKKYISFLSIIMLLGIITYISFIAKDNLGSITGYYCFSSMIEATPFSSFIICFFALLTTWIAKIYFSKNPKLAQTEYFVTLFIMSASMSLLTLSRNLFLSFICIEVMTISFYVLTAYNRRSEASLEAAIKYLIAGATSGAIMLFGLVLLYGAASNPSLEGFSSDPLNFTDLGIFIALNPSNTLVVAGSVLFLCGIFFKVGAFPFQFWIPDVYQGAPMPTTACLAVMSKLVGFVFLISIIHSPFYPLADTVIIPILSISAIATILFSNIAGITQKNVKRLMGLSGISHAGYLLIGLVAFVKNPADAFTIFAVSFYLLCYGVANFSLFGVLASLSTKDEEFDEIYLFKNLYKKSPFLAAISTISIGSLAGIPPFAGFFSKLLILYAVFASGSYVLFAVALIGVVISISYYFGWIAQIFTKLPQNENIQTNEISKDEKIKLGICTFSIQVVLAIFTIFAFCIIFMVS